MARFQLAVRTSNVTSGQALLEIIAGNKGCRLKFCGITLATAVTGVFGIGRPAAKGVAPTTPVNFLPHDGGPVAVGDASLSSVALAWGTSPTAPANFFNRLSVPATIGAIRDISLVHASGAGIWIPAGLTLTLHNVTGGPTLDVDLLIDE